MNVFSCPNCRCGVTCTICSDTNNSGTCGLARITGTATGSTAYYTISTSNGIALSAVTSSTVPEVWAETDFILNTGGDQARLFIKSSSTGNNCWYTETMAGTGGAHFKLYERNAGVDTQRAAKISLTIPTSTPMTMHLCYGEGRIVGTLTGASTNAQQVSYTAATTISNQPYAGVGTGSISSAVKFSNFEHTYGYNATDKPTCQKCLPIVTSCSDVCTAAPTTGASFDVAVDFSGATYTRGQCGVTWPSSGFGIECAECDTFAAEYVLPPYSFGLLCTALSYNCPIWRLEFSTTDNYWCGTGVEETDPSNVACDGGSRVMTLCLDATFRYRTDTAKWHWQAGVHFTDNGVTGVIATYTQDSTAPSIVGDCESGPWTLNRVLETEYPFGPPCDGDLPTSITLRVV